MILISSPNKNDVAVRTFGCTVLRSAPYKVYTSVTIPASVLFGEERTVIRLHITV